MKAWPLRPGVPAAGHVTYKGYWHPGRIEGCVKCEPPKPNQRKANVGKRSEGRTDGESK
jgi:hypothetical protein